MSYLNIYEWEIVPRNLPKVKRNCPKCNGKSSYINCGKFRVNANKNNVDIWMIYQCEKCKSTWNMTIYERTNPAAINKEEYEKFLSNDSELIKHYAYNLGLYSKNKAEVTLDNIEYGLVIKKLEKNYTKENELIIKITCRYPIEVRLDRLISEKLGFSRSRIKNMSKKGLIYINDVAGSVNTKVKNNMEIHVLNAVESEISLENII